MTWSVFKLRKELKEAYQKIEALRKACVNQSSELGKTKQKEICNHTGYAVSIKLPNEVKKEDIEKMLKLYAQGFELMQRSREAKNEN